VEPPVLLDDLYLSEMGHRLVDKEPEHHERKATIWPSSNRDISKSPRPRLRDHELN
jgi:hypothetical protein